MFLKKFLNKFIKHSKDINEDKSNKHNISRKWCQNVTRVLDHRSLEIWDHCYYGFSYLNSEYTKNPAVIEKIFNHLRTAYSIKLYITNTHIEYSAYTIKHGFVCGSCRRGYYEFFEFGLIRTGHRWNIYGEDRSDPTIKAFYEWWGKLVKPYEEEFDNDFNL